MKQYILSYQDYYNSHKNLNDSIIKKTIDEWYKINTNLLIQGWNNITFRGDGTHIDLDVNTSTIRLFTDDYHEYYKNILPLLKLLQLELY